MQAMGLRAGRPFTEYRKLGKTHQNVLIFYKGDIQKIFKLEEFDTGEPFLNYE